MYRLDVTALYQLQTVFDQKTQNRVKTLTANLRSKAAELRDRVIAFVSETFAAPVAQAQAWA